MHHIQPPNADGMTLADIVFPFFLFIAGVSIPLSFEAARRVSTTVLFQGEVESWTWLRTQWWGILGLIGWSYLACALIYFVIGSRREWLVAAIGLLMLNFICSSNGGFFTQVANKGWIEPLMPIINAIKAVVDFVNRFVHIGSQLGSLPATMMSGCALGKLLTQNSDIPDSNGRIRWAMVFATGLFLAGAMTDCFAGINKISATPTWCLWCSSLATLTWVLLYVVLDVIKWTWWSKLLAPAGANPLIAYLLHPIILFVLALTGLGATVRGYSASESGIVAVAGSVGMALVICGLTAAIARSGLRLRV